MAPSRFAQVILADQHQFAAVHPARLVELVEVDLDPVHGKLTIDVDWTRKRSKRAHPYFGIGDPWNVGCVRIERSDGGKGKCRGDCG